MHHATRWLMLLGLLTPNAMQSDLHTTLHLVVYPSIYPKLPYSGQFTGLCPPRSKSSVANEIISSLALLLLRQPLEPLTLQSPLRTHPLHRPLRAVNARFLPFLWVAPSHWHPRPVYGHLFV